MKKVTMYKAFDDMIFNTEKECHEYETKRCNEMIDVIKQIKKSALIMAKSAMVAYSILELSVLWHK